MNNIFEKRINADQTLPKFSKASEKSYIDLLRGPLKIIFLLGCFHLFSKQKLFLQQIKALITEGRLLIADKVINITFLFTLKMLENQRLFDVFRVYRNGALGITNPRQLMHFLKMKSPDTISWLSENQVIVNSD